MSENKNKYATEAEQIAKAIRFGDFTDEWLENNGLSQEYLTLLDNMRRARTRSSFNKAKLEFKKKIVRPFYEQVFVPKGEEARIAFLKRNPIMDFMSPKGLGSYDEIKKNEKVQNSKYATVSINDKGEEVVNVPLLRMINDPGELSDMAHYLDVDADELREHILNEWDKKKKKEWIAEEKAMRNAMINGGKIGKVYFEGRKGVLKEFDNAGFGTELFGSFFPEVYAGLRRDVANGSGESGSIAKWAGEHKKDIALDAAKNAVLIGVGPATTRFIPEAINYVRPVATLGGVGLAETGALALSSYHPLNSENLENARNAALLAATVPGIVGYGLGRLSSSGNNYLRKAARFALTKLKRGEDLPSEMEKKNLHGIVDGARNTLIEFENKNPMIREKDAINSIKRLEETISKTPEAVFDGDKYSYEEIKKLLRTKDGVKELKKVLTAPSQNQYAKWNTVAQSMPGESQTRIDLIEAMDRAEQMFPEAMNEMKYLSAVSGPQKKLNQAVLQGAGLLNSWGSIYEPAKQRSLYEQSFSSYEKSNPEQVEQWKRYGIPEWDPLAAEFKEKYGQPETVMSK